jgi:hypothetical protein
LLEKAVVFEEREHPEIDDQAAEHPCLLPSIRLRPLDADADIVVHERAEPQQQRKPPPLMELIPFPSRNVLHERDRVADEEARVENVAADQQPHLARGIGTQRPMDEEDDRENPQEPKLDEEHRFRGREHGE